VRTRDDDATRGIDANGSGRDGDADGNRREDARRCNAPSKATSFISRDAGSHPLRRRVVVTVDVDDTTSAERVEFRRHRRRERTDRFGCGEARRDMFIFQRRRRSRATFGFGFG
jgi:hypothetical protein